MLIQRLAEAFAPWQSAYSDSKILPALTDTVHLLALLFSGGLAIAADRTTLRVARADDAARAAHLIEMRAVHRPVLIALTVLFISGVALAAADIETFASSPIFWGKMVLVAALLINGAILASTEAKLRSDITAPRRARLWKRFRLNAVYSATLWIATLIAGVVLTRMA